MKKLFTALFGFFACSMLLSSCCGDCDPCCPPPECPEVKPRCCPQPHVWSDACSDPTNFPFNS